MPTALQRAGISSLQAFSHASYTLVRPLFSWRRIYRVFAPDGSLSAFVEQPIGRSKPAIFELDGRADGPGVRIEDDHRDDSRADRQVKQPADRLDRDLVGPSGDRRRLSELIAGVDVGGLDGRSAERVMELVTGWPELNEFKATSIPR